MRPSQRLAQRFLVGDRLPRARPHSFCRNSFLAASPPSSRIHPFRSQNRAFSRFSPFYNSPPNLTQQSNNDSTPPARHPPKVPSYDLTFTCKPCSHRSTHRISKQGYHHGTVLITCPSCKNRHVIADHLRVFNDKAKSFEEILMEKAAPGTELSSLLKKGILGFKGMTVNGQEVPMASEEALEFWEEGQDASEMKHREDYKRERAQKG